MYLNYYEEIKNFPFECIRVDLSADVEVEIIE